MFIYITSLSLTKSLTSSLKSLESEDTEEDEEDEMKINKENDTGYYMDMGSL